MKLSNNKDFSSKDFIEFAKRGPKSAQEKQNIKKGLKKFWDKKGRAVMTVGAGAVALGGVTLAAKSGKIPMPGKNKMTQKSQGLIGGAGPQQKQLSPGKGGVDSQPRVIVTPAPDGNASMVVKGASSPNVVSQVAKTTGGAAGRTYGSGKATRTAMDEGYKTAKPSDPSYKVGAAAAGVFNKIKTRMRRK